MNEGERFRGCLLGLAVGDALGTTLEFKPPESFIPIDDMVGGGPFELKAGEWTDDTSMALCLATSLIESRGFDARDQMLRYCRWERDGYLSSNGRCFDCGITVRRALNRFREYGHSMAGSSDPNTAGNGSLMRLAPVPMFYAFAPSEAIDRAAESSRTTHGALTCMDACRYFAGLLVGALRGEDKSTLLAPRYSPIARLWQAAPLCAEIDEIAAGSFRTKNPPAIVGSGYVVKSLEAALWAFDRSDSFRDACLLAANLGDDADTTAAICGQLAGAFYGESGVPAEWRAKLALKEQIVEIGDKLLTLASARARVPQ